MIYRCPNCNAALEYSPELDKMVCKSCGSSFENVEISSRQSHTMNQQTQQMNRANGPQTAPFPPNGQWQQQQMNRANGPQTAPFPSYNQPRQQVPPNGQFINQPQGTPQDFTKMRPEGESQNMQCNIYLCTSCGAELAVNGVETSTFCAYCGQPTIVFNRVSDMLRPQFIIPFQFDKEKAIMIIRKRLEEGAYIPKAIKNFEIDRVRGIYIPYWLFDMSYHDVQYLVGSVKRGKSYVKRYFLREAQCNFDMVTVDASMNFNDESSQRLEPFFMRDVRKFDVSYMSGFYADRYDQSKNDMQALATYRVQELFNKEVERSVNANNVHIISCAPQCNIKRASYALLPAWFMTFRYKNEAYTMLVNGQTGKIIGTVPFEKKKAVTFICILFCIIAPLASIIFHPILLAVLEDGEVIKLLGFLIILIVVIFLIAQGKLKRFKENLTLTKSKSTERYVKERQDRI